MYRKKIIAALLLLIAAGAVAQPKKTAPTPAASNAMMQLNAVAGKLAQKMKTDPKNPLKVDAASLQKLADALPDGNLKIKLLEYSTRLDNPELSYRQVYWDMAQAFDAVPQAAKMMEFQETSQSLNVLMNKSKLVVNAFKGDLSGLNMSTFTGDPAFMGALTKVTGSADLAQNIGSTLGIGIEIIKAFKADRERKQKFIADYKRFSELSAAMAYAEMDDHLAGALIDAQVMKMPAPVNSIFRYEFDNGARIFAEDGIMKWQSADGKTKKNICLAEPRNDGALDFDYKKPVRYTDGNMVIREDSLMLTPNTNSKQKCPDCIVQPRTMKAGFFTIDNTAMTWINSATGEKGSDLHNVANLKEAKKKAKEMMKNSEQMLAEMRTGLDKSTTYNVHGKQVPINEQIMFVLPSGGEMDIQVFYQFDMDALKRAGPSDPTLWGNMLYVRSKKTKQHNSDLLHNKVAVLAVEQGGRSAIIVGTNGAVARVSLAEANPDALVRSVSEQLSGKALLPAWDLKSWKDESVFEGAGQEYKSSASPLPRLFASPDGKHFIYLHEDNLGYIPVDNLSGSKSFKLTFKPASLNFGKENGDYTINLQGHNEFTFPIVKKYSLKKLVAGKQSEVAELPGLANEPKAEAPSKTKAKPAKATEKETVAPSKKSAKEKPAAARSLADELKKLKDLYDSGALSKDEFDAAKKKLLDQ